MKKLAVLLAAAMLMAGCGGSSAETTAAATSAAAEAQATAAAGEQQAAASDGYVFTVDGTTIAMNAEVAPILEKLGKEKNYFESASCAFEGLDKEYTYNGFVLKTYPLNDVDYVASITLQDDTVATPEGIAIGSELADVTAAYGDSSSDTKCEYVKGDSQLLILLENGVVTSIQYVAITE